MARSSFEIERAVVQALFFRELKTRFGKLRLGYIWAFLEPGAHLMVLVTILGYAMHRTMPDISFPIFLVNGLIPYFLFANIVTRSIGAIEANKGLFNYRPVKPVDTVIARSMLETIIYCSVYILLMVAIRLVGEGIVVILVTEIVLVWVLLVIYSFGVGLIFMVVGKFSSEAAKVIPILIKPLYFFSCIMFPLNAVPEDYRPYLLWNPLVHVVELSRKLVVPGYLSEGGSLGYIALCALISLFTGLALYRLYEEAMLTS